jgi:hypothetical protein
MWRLSMKRVWQVNEVADKGFARTPVLARFGNAWLIA